MMQPLASQPFSNLGRRIGRTPDRLNDRVSDRLEDAFTFPRGTGKLLRPRYPRVLAGVCSGIAQYFGWDASLLRFLVVVLTFATSGLLLVGYIVAWVLLPEGTYALPQTSGTTPTR